MHVSLLGSLTLPDAEIIRHVNNHFALSKVPLIPDFIIIRLVKHYRDYRRDGMSHGWIVNEMKRQRIPITAGAYTLSDMQIGAFVASMKGIESGSFPPNPFERPSWSEAYDMGLGKAVGAVPWGTIALLALGVAAVYGIAGGVTRKVLS